MKAYRFRLVRVHGSGFAVLQFIVMVCLGTLIHWWITRYRHHQEPKRTIEFLEESPPSNRFNPVSYDPISGNKRHACWCKVP